MSDPKITFFKSPADFQKWLDKNHPTAAEVWIGFYKKHTAKAGITYAEALDQALAYGWIDAIRKRIDDSSYTIRFTPRKPKSIWSQVNINRVAELKKLGLMQPSGLKTFDERDPSRSNLYSFEQPALALDADSARTFKANKKAWAFFQAQAPTYQKAAKWWVISAKRPETRVKRLAKLIEDSEHERRLAHLTYTPK